MQIDVQASRIVQLENRLVAELGLTKKSAHNVACKFKSTLAREGAKGVEEAFNFIKAVATKQAQATNGSSVPQSSVHSGSATDASEAIGMAKPWREVFAAIETEESGKPAAKPAEAGGPLPWREVNRRIEGRK